MLLKALLYLLNKLKRILKIKWINVKDQLPESTGYYIIMHSWHGRIDKNNIKVMHFLHTAYGTPVMRWYDSQLSPLVTHWMALPELPKAI